MRSPIVPILILCVVIPTVAYAAAFVVYPGSKPYHAATAAQQQAQSEAKAMGMAEDVYTTSDSYDKVVKFYGALGKPYTMPGGGSQMLPGGKKVEQAFFILDGAKDLSTSKSWVKVQYPLVGGFSMQGMTPTANNIQDVTEIAYVHPAH
jgi:hypothetical protein